MAGAPHLAEVRYTLEDALVVAQWLNVFLRKCDVLKIACMAQIVNIISWLQTATDGLLKHASFYPFALMSNHARGNSLDVVVRAPVYETKQFGEMPLLDVSASHDPATGRQAVFIVNRSQADAVVTDVVWQDESDCSNRPGLAACRQRSQSRQQLGRTRIGWLPRPSPCRQVQDGRVTLSLPPLSFTVLTAAVQRGAERKRACIFGA